MTKDIAKHWAAPWVTERALALHFEGAQECISKPYYCIFCKRCGKPIAVLHSNFRQLGLQPSLGGTENLKNVTCIE